MKKLTDSMTQKEIKWGWIYFAVQMTVLQIFLDIINYMLGGPLSATGMNVVYFSLNFACSIVIFHDFLKKSTKAAFRKPGACLGSAAMGYGLYWLSSMVVTGLILWIYPRFSNVNDNTIIEMLHAYPVLITVCVVVMAPLAEELVFRGLIFRPLYNRNPWLGYTVSAVCFSLPHVLGYLGKHDPVVLLLCFIQYIPAGLCLGWSYARAKTIWAPILIHMTVNLISAFSMLLR